MGVCGFINTLCIAINHCSVAQWPLSGCKTSAEWLERENLGVGYKINQQVVLEYGIGSPQLLVYFYMMCTI